jgi:GntR family phosphonate transport system transcriptional regulator
MNATNPTDDTPGDPVLRQEGVALWRQIAARLKEDIGAGTHAPGSQLPTEAVLSARFAVNRHTVRRALEELSRDGLVRVEQGRGSFVAEDVLDYQVGARTRFSEWIRRHSKEPSGQVRQLRSIAADHHVASRLGLRTGTRIVMLERVGFADDKPVSLTAHYFPVTRLRGIEDALRQCATITDALHQIGVTDYLRQQTRVSARMPTPTEADLLRTARTRPVLVTENINVDRDGAIVEFSTGCYPTPRVQMVFEP